jgi:hypothetical protein
MVPRRESTSDDSRELVCGPIADSNEDLELPLTELIEKP